MMASDSAGKPGRDGPDTPKDDRRQREAAALRENLRKRKAQQRARGDRAGPSAEAPGDGTIDPEAD